MSQKILIADDEPNILISLEFLMKREGYEVLLAANGPLGLRLAEKERPDLVFLDVKMPQMDGLTLLDRLRESHPDVRAIMVSAYSDAGNRRSAIGRGAIDFLTKPVDFRALERLLDQVLVAHGA